MSLGVKRRKRVVDMTQAITSQKGSAAKAAAAVNSAGNSRTPTRNRLFRNSEQNRAKWTLPRAVDISVAIHWGAMNSVPAV